MRFEFGLKENVICWIVIMDKRWKEMILVRFENGERNAEEGFVWLQSNLVKLHMDRHIKRVF